MTVISQSAETVPTAKGLKISTLGCLLVLVGLLAALGVSLVPFAIVGAVGVLLWLAFRYPMIGLGAVLAFMPVYPLAFLLAKFFGPSYIGLLEGSDRVALLLFTFILWRRNGVRFTVPDWFLLICFGLAVARLAFGGTRIGLLTDFNFLIAYAAGRVTILTAIQEKRWARRAVWIVAVLAVLGMAEVFVIGEGPRTLLYLTVANGGTEGQSLDAAFHADQYFGLRESSTMFGPLQFAPLCMAALIVWWVYFRNPLPGAMITAGLICSLTRSAWVGTAVAICALGVTMGQTKRLARYAVLALGLFAAAVPVLSLNDYLLSAKTGQDPSGQSHEESLFGGLEYTLEHPLGSGPGSLGKWAVKEEKNAIGIEDTYLTIAGQYGIPSLLCFVGFLVSALRMLWRKRTQPAFVALGIVVGFGTVMIFAALHDVFPLACWLWFPVGLAIRSLSEPEMPATLVSQGELR